MGEDNEAQNNEVLRLSVENTNKVGNRLGDILEQGNNDSLAAEPSMAMTTVSNQCWISPHDPRDP